VAWGSDKIPIGSVFERRKKNENNNIDNNRQF
jgi:hypothetical protein